MPIIGFIIVVVIGLSASKLLGFSDMAALVGAIIGGGVYILLQIN